MSDTLLDLQYQFNTVNNITQMIDNSGTHGYSYDTLDRLTAATHPNQPHESYTYDDVGNMDCGFPTKMWSPFPTIALPIRKKRIKATEYLC